MLGQTVHRLSWFARGRTLADIAQRRPVLNVTLVIFDCDGVLIDSEAIACRADSACLAELGITITAEEIMERYLGISAIELGNKIVKAVQDLKTSAWRRCNSKYPGRPIARRPMYSGLS